nr:hypothetical protein CFP56_39431 [Quercus suber]
MEVLFEGTIASGKHAWNPSGQIPKESTKGSGDSSDSKKFVNLQCQFPVDVDPMDVECPLLSRVRPEMNKGKGLARNVQLFKGIHKKRGRKRLVVQEMSDSLKSMTDVIIESKSISNPAPFTSTTTIEVQAVMDLVLSLPRVQSGDHLHMFIPIFFM